MSEAGTSSEILRTPSTEQISLSKIFNISLSEDRLRHWAALDFWTSAEAAAIVMEMDPRTAQWEKLKNLPDSDPSVQKFRDIRRLLMRSSKITEEPAPRAILRFLRSKGIDIPQHIFDIVQKIGVKPTSQADSGWKRRYQDLELKYKAAIQTDNYRRVMNIKYLLGYIAFMHADIKIDGRSSLYKQVDSDLAGFEAHMSDDTARSIVKECLTLLNAEGELVEKLSERARNHRLHEKSRIRNS